MDKENKQFFESRVEEIRQNEPPEAWNHFLGTQNPVDLPSRGMGSDALKQSKLWWHGPFLKKGIFGPMVETPTSLQVLILKKCV